uniref:Uncharacterized protein n=1 Tax=Anguilla anguilla TaxID=7936 RepID=A0A0E9XBX3_ANGAN
MSHTPTPKHTHSLSQCLRAKREHYKHLIKFILKMLLFTGSVLPRTTPQIKQSQFQYKYIASAFKHKCRAKKRHYVSLYHCTCIHINYRSFSSTFHTYDSQIDNGVSLTESLQ